MVQSTRQGRIPLCNALVSTWYKAPGKVVYHSVTHVSQRGTKYKVPGKVVYNLTKWYTTLQSGIRCYRVVYNLTLCSHWCRLNRFEVFRDHSQSALFVTACCRHLLNRLLLMSLSIDADVNYYNYYEDAVNTLLEGKKCTFCEFLT